MLGGIEGNSWIAWIVIGLLAGGIAKLLMPGKDPGGCVITMSSASCGALLGRLPRQDGRLVR